MKRTVPDAARLSEMSLLERYIQHARLQDCVVSFSGPDQDAGSVSLPRQHASASWQFCELSTGEVVQIVSTRAKAVRRHTLLSGEYFAIHLVLRGRLSYARAGERSPHTAIGPSGMVVNHGLADEVTLVIEPGKVEVLTFFYDPRRMARIQRNSRAFQSFMALNSRDLAADQRQYSSLFPIDLHVFSDLIADFKRFRGIDFVARRRLSFEQLSVRLLETFLRYAEELFDVDARTSEPRAPSPEVLAANELALNPPKGLLRTRQAARHLAMSESKFKAFYKSQTGQSYKQFREQARQNKARLLLQNSNLSMEQIAELLGYAHLSSFCRSFKRIEGMTASEVRRLSLPQLRIRG